MAEAQHGALQFAVRIGSIELVAAALPPFALDALVEEQDRFRLMRASFRIDPPREALGTLLDAVAEQQPLAPGAVISRGGRPLRLEAITHDLDADPICRGAWVDQALGRLFAVTEARRLGAIGLPIFGIRYGVLTPAESLRLLGSHLAAMEPQSLRRLWLRLPERSPIHTAEQLRELLFGA